MKTFMKLKKIILISLLISLVPATSQAAWYDNLWASVKANAVAFASVAVGAAAILGTLWYKKSAAKTPETPIIVRPEVEKKDAKSGPDVPRVDVQVQPVDHSERDALRISNQKISDEAAQLRLELSQAREQLARNRDAKVAVDNSVPKGSEIGLRTTMTQTNPITLPELHAQENTAQRERIRHLEGQLSDAQLFAKADKERHQAELQKVVGDLQADVASMQAKQDATKATLDKQYADRYAAALERATEAEQILVSERAQHKAEIAALKTHGAQAAPAKELAASDTDTEFLQARIKIQHGIIMDTGVEIASLNAEVERLKKLNQQLILKLQSKSQTDSGAISAATAAEASGDLKSDAPVVTRKEKRAAANAARAAGTSQTTASNNASAGATGSTQKPLTLLAAATAATKVDADKAKTTEPSISLAQIPAFERSANGHIAGYKKLNAEQKMEHTLKSYKTNLTTFSTNAEKILGLAGIESGDQKNIATIKGECDRLIVEINGLLHQYAEMQKSTASLQPAPDADKVALRARNTQALIAKSKKQSKSAFANAEEHVALLEKTIKAHLDSCAKLSDEATELTRTLQTTAAIYSQAEGGFRVVSFLQDRWQPLANLEKTFQTNLVAEKYEPIDAKKAYEYVDLDSASASLINAQVLYEYIMKTVIPTVEQLDPSPLKDKKLNLLRQIGGYLFSNDVMKENYDAFIQGDKALEELKKHGTLERATALSASLQSLRLQLRELEGEITTKISKLGKAKAESPKPSAGANAAAPRTGMVSTALSALGSAASAAVQKIGFGASPAPAVAEDEPFLSLTFERNDQNAIVMDALGAPTLANQSAVMAPPADAPSAATAQVTPKAAQQNADAPLPTVRTATPMPQLKDLSPDAAAGIAAARATGDGAAAGK